MMRVIPALARPEQSLYRVWSLYSQSQSRELMTLSSDIVSAHALLCRACKWIPSPRVPRLADWGEPQPQPGIRYPGGCGTDDGTDMTRTHM